MIQVFAHKKKDGYDIIAVADHQKDLNNLRLMSYQLVGKDAVFLMKAEFGGPYLKLKADAFKSPSGEYDLPAMQKYIDELGKTYN